MPSWYTYIKKSICAERWVRARESIYCYNPAGHTLPVRLSITQPVSITHWESSCAQVKILRRRRRFIHAAHTTFYIHNSHIIGIEEKFLQHKHTHRSIASHTRGEQRKNCFKPHTHGNGNMLLLLRCLSGIELKDVVCAITYGSDSTKSFWR